MAEKELLPWEEAAKVKKGTAAPELPPWAEAASKLQPQVGYGEDIAKGVVPAAAQGIMAVAGMPGDLQALAKAGSEKATEKGINPFSALGEAFANSRLGKFLQEDTAKHPTAIQQAGGGDLPGSGGTLPTSAGIQKKAEEVTGPFYKSQYGPGKAMQTGLRVAPSLLIGGGGVPGALLKSAGAGVLGEGAVEGANALKGYLPDVAQPWAEPAARAAGVMAGTFTPAGVRRAVTPLPLSPERTATVNALRATNPELVEASSAGQLAEAPRLMAAEGRAPRMTGLPERQGEAYTQGVMRQAGTHTPGAMFDTAGLAEARGTGAQIEALRNAHEINPTEFALLNRDVGRMGAPGSDLYRAVGPSEPFAIVRNALLHGPGGGNPPPLSMTGQRYGAMKQITQNAAEGAPTSHEQMAILAARERMNEAFHNSMPAAEAERLRNLDQQYSNYKTIENIPAKVGENIVTPQQVSSKATRGGPLDVHAENAASMMQPLPKPNMEGGPGTKVLGGLAGLLGGAAAGGATAGATGAVGEGLLGAFAGASHANDVVQALKNAGGRVVARPGIQNYLKNQRWMPGPATSIDPVALARLLMAPPTNPTQALLGEQ